MVYYKNYTYCNPLIHRVFHIFQCIVQNHTIHVQVAENQSVLKKHVEYV